MENNTRHIWKEMSREEGIKSSNPSIWNKRSRMVIQRRHDHGSCFVKSHMDVCRNVLWFTLVDVDECFSSRKRYPFTTAIRCLAIFQNPSHLNESPNTRMHQRHNKRTLDPLWPSNAKSIIIVIIVWGKDCIDRWSRYGKYCANNKGTHHRPPVDI